MLATLSLSFNHLASQSAVLTSGEQQHVAQVLEHDAQVLSNTQLANQLVGQPKATRDEIISINTDARHDALRFALLVPLFAGLVGLFNSFRMMRLPDPPQSESTEGLALG